MKTSPSKRFPRGFVSFLLVLTTGAILTMLMIYAYRGALQSQDVQAQVQLRVDYSEKEEAILRSIVAITPNRAIRAMQSGAALDGTRDSLSWEGIFTDSLIQANARTSISDELRASLGGANLRLGNSGDSTTAGDPTSIFRPGLAGAGDGHFVSAGINRGTVPAGYPTALISGDATTSAQDVLYPIISDLKMGVGLAAGTTPNFNVLPYPNINFGYARPGENFVAKRNWWAFSVDAAAQDAALTHLARKQRKFVLSIYEVPSQLAISAASFMSLGQYEGGSAWQNVAIEGGIFAGKAEVLGPTALNALATRQGGTTMAAGATIGGENFTGTDPFAPGVRETFQVTRGAFFPVSLASESGRAAFIPISRGELFFDRFALPAESNTLSTTTWNNYTIGALQCAMRLDIREVDESTKEPTILRFEYFLDDGTRAAPMDIVLTRVPLTSLPEGYVAVADGVEPLPGEAVDLAYRVDGQYYFEQGVSGAINFDGTFKLGTGGAGFWRPRCPFEIKKSPQTSQFCVAVNGERIPAFLDVIGAAPAGPGGAVAVRYNNSLVVNVDYSNIGPNYPTRPNIPCTDTDYGVVLDNCKNLTAFTSGFSLVTNLRLFIADDFAQDPTASGGVTPTSLFCPEKRIGFGSVSPLDYQHTGRIGSLTKGYKVNEGDDDPTAVRPLDIKKASGEAFAADKLSSDLKQIRRLEDLPPINMMNWLVLLEEVR